MPGVSAPPTSPLKGEEQKAERFNILMLRFTTFNFLKYF